MIANLPGKATHLKAGRSTACGVAGTVLKTDDWRGVDCRRCRRSTLFAWFAQTTKLIDKRLV